MPGEASGIRIACIVLPPGHGKSFNHGKLPGLLEADKVFDCKGSERLCVLRTQAKLDGKWGDYNREWAVEIVLRLPPDRCVVMVPSFEVAKEISCLCLGALALKEEVWARNLAGRQGDTDKYRECWMRACDEGLTLASNDELNEQLHLGAKMWLR